MLRSLLVSTLLLALVCAAPAGAQSNSDRARQARAELEQLQAKIEQVKNAISAGRDRHEELAAQLARAGQAVRQAAQELDRLNSSVAALQQQVADLRRQRDQEQNHLGDELDTLRAQVQAAYRTGQTSKLRMLLSAENPARLGRMLVYYGYFTRAQTQQVAELQGMLAALAQRQSALEAKQQELTEQQQARAASLARMQHSRAERQAALQTLEERIAAQESSLEDYRAAAKRLQDLIAALNARLADSPAPAAGAFTALKGRMRAPLDGPVLAHFGTPKANGLLHWQGQWRAAPAGTPVHAMAAGRVVYIGYLHHYGLVVVLQHADNYFTVYGHVAGSYVDVGDHVRRNGAIAAAGSSGGHRRSGVYFEIRKGEQALDPSIWLGG